MVGGNNQRSPNRQHAVGTPKNGLLDSVLDLNTEEAAILIINAAVHESVAVGRGNQTVVSDSKNVGTLYVYLGKRRKSDAPLLNQRCVDVDEM